MSKITEFTRTNCSPVDADIRAALKAVADKYGIVFAIKGGTFSPNTYSPKIEFAVVAADGAIMNREAEAFKQLAGMYGLKPEHFGAKFRSGGREFTICGLKSRAGRLPILAKETQSGKTFKFNNEDVARALGLPAPMPAGPDSTRWKG